MADLERLLPGYDLRRRAPRRRRLRCTKVRCGGSGADRPSRWRRTASAAPKTRTAGVYVFPSRTPLDLDGELTAGWRASDVWWQRRRGFQEYPAAHLDRELPPPALRL